MIMEYFGLKQNPFSLSYDESFFALDPNKDDVYEQISHDLHSGCNPILLLSETKAESLEFVQYLTSCLPSHIERISPIQGDMNYCARVLMAIDILAEQSSLQGKKLLLIIENALEITEADLKLLLLLPRHYDGDSDAFQMIWCGSDELLTRLIHIDAKKYAHYRHCYALDTLTLSQIRPYINARLEQVGYWADDSGELFSSEAIEKIATLSQGRRQSINQLCSASLQLANRRQLKEISLPLVVEAAKQPSLDTSDKKNKSYTNKTIEDILLNQPSVILKPLPLQRSVDKQAGFYRSHAFIERLPFRQGFFAAGVAAISISISVILTLSVSGFFKLNNVVQLANLEPSAHSLPLATLGQQVGIIQQGIDPSLKQQADRLDEAVLMISHQTKLINPPSKPLVDTRGSHRQQKADWLWKKPIGHAKIIVAQTDEVLIQRPLSKPLAVDVNWHRQKIVKFTQKPKLQLAAQVNHPPIKSEPMLDAQEMAARDRAAHRLALYRLGAEPSDDALYALRPVIRYTK